MTRSLAGSRSGLVREKAYKSFTIETFLDCSLGAVPFRALIGRPMPLFRINIFGRDKQDGNDWFTLAIDDSEYVEYL